MKKLIILVKENLYLILGALLILFFIGAYISLTLNKYWQFEYFFTDNVYFDSALWKVSQFQAPIVEHTILGKIVIFGDHFSPTIFFFSLLYMLTSRQEVIFIATSIVYGLSGYFGLLMGLKLLKNKLAVFALLISYFLYIGVQNAFLFGFHETVFVAFFFMLTAFCLIFGHKKFYWINLVFLLLTKESTPILIAPFAFFIFFAFPEKRKTAIVTFVLAVIYFLVATRIIIPSFSGRYLYSEINYPTNVSDFVNRLTLPQEKIETFLISMWTFGFLPLLNILTLPMVLQDFVIRFVFSKTGNVQYSLFYHYGMGLAPILFLSSIWSLHLFQKDLILKRIIPAIVIFTLLSNFYLLRFHKIGGHNSPLMLIFNSTFYQVTKNNEFLHDFISHVPRDGSIMTQNHLGFYFAHREVHEMTIRYSLFRKLKPKYIVFDIRDGQNVNNYFPLTRDDTKRLALHAVATGEYVIKFKDDDRYILERIKTYPVNICVNNDKI